MVILIMIFFKGLLGIFARRMVLALNRNWQAHSIYPLQYEKNITPSFCWPACNYVVM